MQNVDLQRSTLEWFGGQRGGERVEGRQALWCSPCKVMRVAMEMEKRLQAQNDL